MRLILTPADAELGRVEGERRHERTQGSKGRVVLSDDMTNADVVGARGEIALARAMRGEFHFDLRSGDPGWDVETPDGMRHQVQTKLRTSSNAPLIRFTKHLDCDFLHFLREVDDQAFEHMGFISYDEWTRHRRVAEHTPVPSWVIDQAWLTPLEAYWEVPR